MSTTSYIVQYYSVDIGIQPKKIKIRNSVKFDANFPPTGGLSNALRQANLQNQSIQYPSILKNGGQLMSAKQMYATTDSALKNLKKRNKSPIIDQTISINGSSLQYNTTDTQSNEYGRPTQSMAEEYRQRQKEMDQRLNKEINNNKIASVYIVAGEGAANKRAQSASGIPLQPISVNSDNRLPFEQKPVQFVRSNRSIALRIKDSYEDQVGSLETEKLKLIQRLNEAMIQLDKLSYDKGELNDKLIALFQFCRDCEKQTLRSDDLMSVVDVSLKDEMRSEKQQGVCLREQLKFIEGEHFMINQRLSLTNDSKSEFEQNKKEVQYMYDHRDKDTASLIKESTDTIARIEAYQSQVDDLRKLCMTLKELADGHRHDLHHTHDGRLSLADQFENLERKYLNAVDQLKRERNEIHYRHGRRLKKLGTNFLVNNLQTLVNKQFQEVFCAINMKARVFQASKDGLNRMKLLLKQNRKNTLQKALNIWYFGLLKPMRNSQQSKRVGKLVNAKNPVFLAFSKWRQAFQLSIRSHHIKLAMILRMVQLRHHQGCVAMKNYLHKWRRNINMRYVDKSKLLGLGKMLVRKDEQRLRERLYRWKAVSLELDNQIELNGMAQRLVHKTLIASVYQALRFASTKQKNKRLSIKNRTWKQLVSYVIVKKQLRCQALMILRESQLRKYQNLRKQCFDELRLNKQEEKYFRAQNLLVNVELPTIQKTLIEISQIEVENKKQLKLIAIRNVLKIRTKKYFQYLKKWRDETDNGIETMKTNILHRVIYRYKWILTQAFNRWVDYRGKQIVCQQKDLNVEWEDLNKRISNEITSQELVVEAQKMRQRSSSAKALKQLIMEAFERHIREKFVQWRTNIRNRSKEAEFAEELIIKLERRFKKLAFKIFVEKTLQLREEADSVVRGNDARTKLQERLILRTFKSFRKSADTRIKAKLLLMKLGRNLDMSLKDESFRLWIRTNQLSREQSLENMQNDTVSRIAQSVSEIGGLSDQVEVQVQHNKNLTDRYRMACQKVITLAFKRCHHMAQQYFFERWRQSLLTHQRSKSLILNALNHTQRESLSYSFHRWIQNCSIYSEQKKLLAHTQREMRIIAVVKIEKQQNDKVFDCENENLSTKLQKENVQHQILESKYHKMMKSIIDRVRNNNKMFRLRYILIQWKDFAQTRKRCVNSLVLAVRKTLWQSAFTEIKEFSNQLSRANRKEVLVTKLYFIFSKCQFKKAMSRWQSQCQQKVAQVSRKTQQDNVQLIKEHKKVVKNVNNRVKQQLRENCRQTSLLDCYTAWKVQIDLLKCFRIKTSLHQEWQKASDKKNSIILWRSRYNQTKNIKRGREILNQKYARSLIITAFQQLAHHNSVQKAFCRSLSNIANKFDSVYTRRAFQTLSDHRELRGTQILFSKYKSCQNLSQTLKSISDKLQLQVLTVFREGVVTQKRNGMKLRAIAKYWVGQKLRGYVRQWKEQSDRKEVVIHNTEEGPIAVEVHNLKRVVLCLKSMCLKEGIGEEKFQRIIAKSKQVSTERLMKTVSRLLCHGDQDLRLIPQTFDRWRQWVKYRKAFKYQLNFANSFSSPHMHALCHAFRKWRSLQVNRQQELTGRKREELKQLCIKNNDRMGAMTNNFHASNDIIQDLTGQRDLLLVRYIGSQKLALASSKASCDRAKQKVLSRWLSQNQRAEKAQIEAVLKRNIMHIAALKERIKQNENKNHNLAEQNEELRQGALDGLEMAKSIDELSREREIFSVNMAEKSLVIRRLLEDNQLLNLKVAQAQESAHYLIQATQRRLNL